MIRQSTVLVPECADFRVPICDFSPENDPPNTVLVPECADLLVHFGSKGVQKVTFRANYRRAQACSTAISPSQEFQTERDTRHTHTHRTNIKFKLLLHNSPFGAIIFYEFCILFTVGGLNSNQFTVVIDITQPVVCLVS